MRLWIAVHLPLLPLEAFRPRWSDPGPHAVMDRDRVIVLSTEAARDGVRVGMRRGGVAAIAPGTTLHDRDLLREQAALDSVAITLLQYTPEVAMSDEITVLLDVTASLRAFGGRLAMCRRIRHSVDALGLTAVIGAAPTASGAWLLAHRQRVKSALTVRRVLKLDSLCTQLNALPCTLLPQNRPYQIWLDGIGCRTLGDLRKLPRAGLQRRMHKDVLDALDRAYGQAPELFDWVVAPTTFAARLELPDRIEHADAVLFGARRLLVQLTGWLVALQQAVSRFLLLLEHERGRTAIAPTPVDITLAEPAWHEEHLVRLLKERLGRLELCAPVIALRLEATHLSAMLPPTASLFPEPGGTPADYHRLLELLTARLGVDCVLCPAPLADYRPEVCNAWTPATTGKQRPVPEHEPLARPFWLLAKPIALLVRDHRPFYGSPLRLVSGPERIEAGWWDGQLAVRDYFVAQGSESACYWVYQERTAHDAQWFLHGLFA